MDANQIMAKASPNGFLSVRPLTRKIGAMCMGKGGSVRFTKDRDRQNAIYGRGLASLANIRRESAGGLPYHWGLAQALICLAYFTANFASSSSMSSPG